MPPPGPAGTHAHLGNFERPVLRHGDCTDILVHFLVHQAFLCHLLCQRGTQRRQNKPQSWDLPLSSLLKLRGYTGGPGLSPASGSLGTLLRRPSYSGQSDFPSAITRDLLHIGGF